MIDPDIATAVKLFHTLTHSNDPKFMDRAIAEYDRVAQINAGPGLGKFLIDFRERWDAETPGTPQAMEIQDMLHGEGGYRKN